MNKLESNRLWQRAVEPKIMACLDELSSELDFRFSEAANAMPEYMQQYTAGVKNEG